MKSINTNSSFKEKKLRLINQPTVLFSFVVLCFFIIISRLLWLQVLKGNYYKELSDENRIRLVYTPPIRGRFIDRNGEVLVKNKLLYSISIQPLSINRERWPILRNKLSQYLGLSQQKMDLAFNEGLKKQSLRVILSRDISDEMILRFKEQEQQLQGAQIYREFVRSYPFGSLAAHSFGYTQFITDNEYNALSKEGYSINDRIGRTGLEAAYESHLRGQWGGELLEVDSLGIVQKSLGFRAPKSGKDLSLTIDLRLQQAAESALKDKSAGAIVALDPRTGAILAMASKPTFSPEFFTQSKTNKKEYDDLFLGNSLPFLSRALNAYDPGSTWKVVTGMAGMESGKFPPKTKLETAPCIKYGGHCFPEHNKKGFGRIGYADAFRVSSNTFFYQVGVGTGSRALYEAAIKLGFDQLTGIELKSEESKGLVGNEIWANSGRGWGKAGQTPWIPEDIASASIGQSVVQVTPLQLARAYAVFANGGFLITPHFVDREIDWTSTPYRKKVDIKPSTINTIRNGLRQVVRRGTGMQINYNLPNLPPVAGKTGTAEDSSGGLDHAWFACFAPYEESEIVVVAFAQNTPGGGSVHALPMARQMLEIWQLIRSSDSD
ncbi:penicillin-binding protein 2 [Prochlorococcus sp. MIT 1223]|uniref:penicillin-binding protein 2 n=1 Tax=Prochlorococcus sp. MIT 1223 TaxID=3096217 RepID=UPI002A747BD2|nr:penicillin-binding protein 2 [Prochlorococcus sp. MIT 1223]